MQSCVLFSSFAGKNLKPVGFLVASQSMIYRCEKPRRRLSQPLMESAWYESVENTKFFFTTIRSSTFKHIVPNVGGRLVRAWKGALPFWMQKLFVGYLRPVLRCILHDEMEHCCLVCFIEEPIGCAKAVRNGGECVSHQFVKTKFQQVLSFNNFSGTYCPKGVGYERNSRSHARCPPASINRPQHRHQPTPIDKCVGSF